jgi:hypothetical protein
MSNPPRSKLAAALRAALGGSALAGGLSGLGLGQPRERAAGPEPETPEANSGNGSLLASEIQARAGRTLESLHVQPVPPGHKHEPPPQRFNVVGDTVYVRACDAGALQASLLRRRRRIVTPGALERRDQPGGPWVQVRDPKDEYVQALGADVDAMERLAKGLEVRMFGPAGDVDFRYARPGSAS